MFPHATFQNGRYHSPLQDISSATKAVSVNASGQVCYDDKVCEDECCQSLELGMPYCCSKYHGFVYLALMLGGGIIIAILIVACYVFMKRSERELEAAARLEEAKAANRGYNNNSTRVSSDTQDTDLNEESNGGSVVDTQDLNQPPPAYNEVIRTFVRCHSCDVNMTHNSASQVVESSTLNHLRVGGPGAHGAGAALSRQHSDDVQLRLHPDQQRELIRQLGNIDPALGLPALVNVSHLLAQHWQENFMPPPPSGLHLNSPLVTPGAMWSNSHPHLQQQQQQQQQQPQQQQQQQQTQPAFALPMPETDQWSKLPTYEEYTAWTQTPAHGTAERPTPCPARERESAEYSTEAASTDPSRTPPGIVRMPPDPTTNPITTSADPAVMTTDSQTKPVVDATMVSATLGQETSNLRRPVEMDESTQGETVTGGCTISSEDFSHQGRSPSPDILEVASFGCSKISGQVENSSGTMAAEENIDACCSQIEALHKRTIEHGYSIREPRETSPYIHGDGERQVAVCELETHVNSDNYPLGSTSEQDCNRQAATSQRKTEKRAETEEADKSKILLHGVNNENLGTNNGDTENDISASKHSSQALSHTKVGEDASSRAGNGGLFDDAAVSSAAAGREVVAHVGGDDGDAERVDNDKSGEGTSADDGANIPTDGGNLEGLA